MRGTAELRRSDAADPRNHAGNPESKGLVEEPPEVRDGYRRRLPQRYRGGGVGLADYKTWQRTPPTHGHGSIAGIRMHNPLMFFLQVRRRYGKCIRSNNVCLIVLPCPWLLCSLFCDLAFCTKKLLLLGGDIETNPGPDLAFLSKQLELIALDLKDIKEQRLTSIEAKLESLAFLDKKVSSCVDQVAHLQTTVRTLELKIDDLENQSRRSNLLVFGVPESEKENNANLDKLINETIITDILKCSPVAIERIHRLGKPRPNKQRPIILKLVDSREKNTILKSCSKLKGTNYSISEDFSARVRDIRKKLWNYGKPKKEAGDKVALAYDKLWINDEPFYWDDVSNKVIPLKTVPNIAAQSKNQRTDDPSAAPPALTLRPRRANQLPK